MSHVYPHIHHQHLLPQLGSHTHQAHPFTPFGLPNNSTNHVSSQHNRYMFPCNSATNRESSSSRNVGENYFSAACNPNLPRYMWGPPPPYSQPTSLENVNVEEGNDNTNPVADNHDNLVVDDTTGSGVSPSITSPSIIVASNGSPIRNNFDQQPNLTRTTKSGILLSPPGSQNENMLPTSITAKDSPITSLVTSNNSFVEKATNDGSIKNTDTYDESVDSAMHIYEQAKHKSGLTDAEVKVITNDNNSNSLPLRRMKKRLDLVPCKSEANLSKTGYTEEEHLVKEVRQKLNELGLYKYQKSKAARELAEIRQALNNLQNPYISGKDGPAPQNVLQPHLEFPKPSIQMQSLPLPPIPVTSGTNSLNGANQVYQAPSIVSSACSTNENKYETIGKSINPYKITLDDKKDDVVFSNTTSPSDSSYGFIASSMSPMSIQTNKSSVAVSGEETSSSNDSRRHSPFPTRQSVSPPSQNSEEDEQINTKNYLYKAYKCFRKKESSHCAQISPLRGQGAPMLSSIESSPHRNNLPHMSYFQVKLYIV